MAAHNNIPSSELIQTGTTNPLELFDRKIFRALYFGTRNPVFNVLMPFISIAGNRGAAHLLIGSTMIAIGNFAMTGPQGRHMYLAGIALIAATGLAGVFAEGTVKFIWKRKRPFQVMPDVKPLVPSKRLEHRPSFPSGHASGYLAATTAVSLFFPHYAPFLIAAGVFSAFSRIYNGVHFPSDVLAGMTIGVASGYAVFKLLPLLPI